MLLVVVASVQWSGQKRTAPCTAHRSAHQCSTLSVALQSSHKVPRSYLFLQLTMQWTWTDPTLMEMILFPSDLAGLRTTPLQVTYSLINYIMK